MVPNTVNAFNDEVGTLQDECQSEYTLHDGTILLPVMGDSTQVPVVIRLHPPYTTRHSQFRFRRTKTPPVIPPPGDTLPNGVVEGGTQGDTYLGGSITLPAPTQNSNTDLVYTVSGGYNYLVANDVRMHGKMRFDGHGYQSMVDFLGWVEPPDDTTWVSPYYDLNLLASARILG